jgi:hypothetical protein
MMMLEKNNLKIAALIAGWLKSHVPARNGTHTASR